MLLMKELNKKSLNGCLSMKITNPIQEIKSVVKHLKKSDSYIS